MARFPDVTPATAGLMGVVVATIAMALGLRPAAVSLAASRWAEAEEKLKETPVMLKTPSGYVQQSPWLSVANKQMELMGRYMAELGITRPRGRGSQVPDRRNRSRSSFTA